MYRNHTHTHKPNWIFKLRTAQKVELFNFARKWEAQQIQFRHLALRLQIRIDLSFRLELEMGGGIPFLHKWDNWNIFSIFNLYFTRSQTFRPSTFYKFSVVNCSFLFSGRLFHFSILLLLLQISLNKEKKKKRNGHNKWLFMTAGHLWQWREWECECECQKKS